VVRSYPGAGNRGFARFSVFRWKLFDGWLEFFRVVDHDQQIEAVAPHQLRGARATGGFSGQLRRPDGTIGGIVTGLSPADGPGPLGIHTCGLFAGRWPYDGPDRAGGRGIRGAHHP